MNRTSPPIQLPDGPRRRLLKTAASAAAAALASTLAGCGGGSAGADPVAPGAAQPAAATDAQPVQILGIDSGGTGRSSFFSATVTAVAPLVVAGVQFGTASSQIVDADGRALAAASLAPGMSAEVQAGVVSVVAGTPQAEARTVRVAEQLIGAVSAVDAANVTITVLGQRVLIDAGTRFATTPAAAFSDLVPGTLVRVWGQIDLANQRIVATRIDVPQAGSAGVLRGALTALDATAGTVVIGGYALAAPAGFEWPAGLTPGGLVRAQLQPASANAMQSLRADPLALPNRGEAEIEGRISAIDAALRFWVDGVCVDAQGAVVTPGAAALALGAHVEVHGHAAGGVLVAATVAVDSESGDATTELEGSITSVDAVGRSFLLRGVEVSWTDATVFVGGAGAALLAPHRQVNVKGPRSSNKLQLLARTIHIEA